MPPIAAEAQAKQPLVLAVCHSGVNWSNIGHFNYENNTNIQAAKIHQALDKWTAKVQYSLNEQ